MAGLPALRSTARPTIWPWPCRRAGQTGGGSAPTGGGLVQAEVAGENALLERNLSVYDCLFLCNVAQFTAGEAHAIGAYLEGGGSAIFFLGDQVSADRYNQELGVAGENPPAAEKSGQNQSERSQAGQGRAGQGKPVAPRLLPAKLGNVKLGSAAERSPSPSRLDPLGYRHPIVQAFRGRGQNSLLTTPIFKYFQLALPPDSPAETVLAMPNGDPLIVERPHGRGRVLLVATSADPSWTAMPLWPSFVPLVQEIVVWCAAGQLRQRNIAVGEPIEAVEPAAASEASPSVQSPDGRSHSIRLRAAGDASWLTYADTAQSGIYALRFGPPINRSRLFAVNVDPSEGDLKRTEPAELRNDLWPNIPFVCQTSWRDMATAAAGAALNVGSRLHVDLLYAVLGLLFLETFFAWRLGEGVNP